MSTRAQITSEINSRINDNTTQDITPLDVRTVLALLNTNGINVDDDVYTAGKYSQNLLLTRADVQADIASSSLIKNAFYRISDAVGNTREILVQAENDDTLFPMGVDSYTGEVGTYDITTDVFTATSGGGGGIKNGTAAGTDTYTTTISGVSSYTDGDAYLIKFTNGNTTSCTININSLGAKSLYRNNDGAVIGGDIWAGATMLCVYNSTLDGFQCIGTSSNSIFSYVTNAEATTITKGQVVYAFGGTGDRMTVKLALNTSDATSAKTVGVVLSTSIAANQKGIIIMQGLLDGLSILPTSTYADGDTIYLGATAGSITKTKPYAPNHLVYVGIVTTASNGSAGRMYVRVQNGYELDEIHDVSAQTPSNNNGLFYNSTTGLWTARAVAATDIDANVSNTEFSYLDGVTSAIQTQLDSKQASSVSFNRQTASYTLAASDVNKMVEMNVATANNLTVPVNSSVSIAVGSIISVSQYGAGQTTIVAASGVTLRSVGSWLKIAARYGVVSLLKVGTDEWYVYGALTA